jgi:phosphatidate cytidylyltransferase
LTRRIEKMIRWYNSIPEEIKLVFLFVFALLILTSIIFYILDKTIHNHLTSDLIKRNNSWWKIAIGVFIIGTFPRIYGTIIVAFISFSTLREMLSISPLRASDRLAIFLCYLAVPIQFHLAYVGFYNGFIIFITLIMFIIIPIILMLSGSTKGIGRSMSIIPSILLVTVYMPSHLMMLFHLEFKDFLLGGTGLLLYVIILASFNDIFQYIWGKLLGNKKKMLPKIVPDRTYGGFLLGLISTAGLAILIRFLTPFTFWQAILLGTVIGICGFFGDALLQAIKRDLKIRDTGSVLPGHGGFLDRLDSLIIAIPIYYHIIRYIANLS